MRKRSFRTLIILTLVLVTGIISFVSFHTFSHFLEKKIYGETENNIVLTASLMKEQFYSTFNQHDGRILRRLTDDLKDKDQVINSYLYNGNRKLIFPDSIDTTGNPIVPWEEISGVTNDLHIKSFPKADIPFSRVYISIPNSPDCYSCHGTGKENLGLLVVDISNNRKLNIDKFITSSSAIFTLVMIVFIGIFILFMHYRFIRRSLREFTNTINEINRGNLDKRLTIPETRELGLLGLNFNNMLDTLRHVQNELEAYHKKELERNFRLATIGEMAARLAHQVRNPLMGIGSAVEIIVKQSQDAGNKLILEEIRRQSQKVNASISGILKYSRKKELLLEKNDINPVIHSIVPFLKNMSSQKKILLCLSLQENIPSFKFDKAQMEDVLINLGLNSIQAIEEKGSVTYKTEFDPGKSRVYISVSDTGPGIREENLSSIFQPFFTTKNEGTGLGLSIVKEILDKHGYEIQVKNNETQGCTFTISMPVTTINIYHDQTYENIGN